MNHIEKLNWRYAAKDFDTTKKVSDEDLNSLAESLRLAASSFGLQPWKFLFISNEDIKKELLPVSWNQGQVVNCSHHVVFCMPTKFGDEDVDRFVKSTAEVRGQSVEELEGYGNMMKGFISKMNEDQKMAWMKNQVYLALGSFLVTCAELGIDSCPMEGISQPDYDKILGLADKGLQSVVACPVGYRSTDDKYSSLPKVRYPQSDVIEFL